MSAAPDQILNDVIFTTEEEYEAQMEEWLRQRGGRDFASWNPALHPRNPKGPGGGRFRSLTGLLGGQGQLRVQRDQQGRRTRLDANVPLAKGQLYRDPLARGPESETVVITKMAKGRIYFGPRYKRNPTTGEMEENTHASGFLTEAAFRKRMRLEPNSPEVVEIVARNTGRSRSIAEVIHSEDDPAIGNDLRDFYEKAGLRIELPPDAPVVDYSIQHDFDATHSAGGIHYDKRGKPEYIRFDPSAPGAHRLPTAGHEFAHYLDAVVFGWETTPEHVGMPRDVQEESGLEPNTPVKFAGSLVVTASPEDRVGWKDRYGLQEVFDAMIDSKAMDARFTALQNFARMGLEGRLTGNAEEERYARKGIEYTMYLNEPSECWARAVEQFLRSRNPESGDMNDLRQYTFTGLGRGGVPIYWDDEDFEPIAKALEKVFTRAGWLGKRKAERRRDLLQDDDGSGVVS